MGKQQGSEASPEEKAPPTTSPNKAGCQQDYLRGRGGESRKDKEFDEGEKPCLEREMQRHSWGCNTWQETQKQRQGCALEGLDLM